MLCSKVLNHNSSTLSEALHPMISSIQQSAAGFTDHSKYLYRPFVNLPPPSCITPATMPAQPAHETALTEKYIKDSIIGIHVSILAVLRST